MSSSEDVSNLTEEERTILSMTVGQRIALRIKMLAERGWPEDQLTPTALSRACKVDRSVFYQLEQGDMKTMRAHNMVALADYLECEVRWLAIGRGPIERQRSVDETELLEIFSELGDHGRASVMQLARMIRHASNSASKLADQADVDPPAAQGG